ncbi:MAG TPA: PRC-barrel domain-containing protein [Solirubrobacterales bacterium]|nr:PRC-barrel domain-containing protein [Solirubrobacterales bacterium]
MSDAAAAAPPSLEQARGWIGLELDDVEGRAAGRIEGVYADAESGAPVWLLVAVGRRRRGFLGFGRRSAKTVAVPFRECAAMPARAWTAQSLEALRGAPAVDASRPLLGEHEAAICAHYGIGDGAGRLAELASRAAAAITAQPA